MPTEDVDIRILVIEDNPGDARLIREYLSEPADATAFLPDVVETFAEAQAFLGSNQPDIVLLDLSLPDSMGIDTVERFVSQWPYLPMIVLTGMQDRKTAAQAVACGAQDYLVKNHINAESLRRAIDYAMTRKELERVRIDRDAAEKASGMKSDIISLISHELRTPLNAVIGFSRAMIDGAYGDVSALQTERLEQIAESGEELSEQVAKLIELAQLESGRSTLNEEYLDALDLLYDALRSMQQRFEEKSIETVFKKTVDVAPIMGDAKRIRRTWDELISRAHKHTPAGGTVRIRAFEDTIPDHGSGLHVSISYTGGCIPEQERQAVFTLFNHDNDIMQHSTQGLGAGLPLVKKVLELHDGRIWIDENKEGEKACVFHVVLPLESHDD
jgi:signal transduction histidine kinase